MASWFGKDLARMYSVTTGDSDITLTTAVPGCKTFAQANVADSDTVNYGIITYDLVTHRPVGSETGLGKYISSGTVLKRTTVLSSISLDSDDVMDSQITLTGLSEIYIPYLEKDVLRVKESDSDPNVYPVNTIVVTNGKLTDDGSGQVTLDLSGGGGAGGNKWATYYQSTGQTVNSTVTGATLNIDTEDTDTNNLASVGSNTLTFGANGPYMVTILVELQSTGAAFNGRIVLHVADSAGYTMDFARGYATADGITVDWIPISFFSWGMINDTISATIDNLSGVNITALWVGLSIQQWT